MHLARLAKTPAGRARAAERHRFMQLFVQQLREEVAGRR